MAEIFDICPIAKSAMLSIVSTREVLPFLFEPVDDRIGILLHGGSEHNQVIPFAHLQSLLANL